MDLKIKGKTAIMAGGSAGLGRATAERLAEAGVELFITARREERLNRAAEEIAKKYNGANVTPDRRGLLNRRRPASLVRRLPKPGHFEHHDQAAKSKWQLS